jgi:subtilisin family serine protease
MTEPSGVVVTKPPPSATGAVVAAGLTGTWVVGVTVVLQGLGWLADQLLIYYAGTPPWWIWLVAGLLNAVLVGVPSALLAFIPRSAAVRATGRVWLVGAAAVGLLGVIRAIPSDQPELSLLLLAVIAAGGALFLRRLTPPAPAAMSAASAQSTATRPDQAEPAATPSTTNGPGTRWLAATGGLVVLLPWLWLGALGGVLESLLAVAAAAALGWLAATVLDRWLWESFLRLRILLGGPVAGVGLLLLAAGAGASGAQLALMLVLPPLGFAAAALRRTGWLVGLAALGPLALVDSEEISLLLAVTRDVPFWTAIAATGSLGLAVLLGLGYAFRPALPRWVAAATTAVLALAAAGIYFGPGQPGLYGERLFVVMADQADLTGIPAGTGQAGRDARAGEVYRRLVAHAGTSQAGLRAELDRFGLSYTPYYLVNAIEVAGGPEVRAWLSRRDDVDRVLGSQRLRPLPATGSPLRGTAGLVPEDPEWNVAMVRADRVWDELGVTGEGIVVGSSDSGVDGAHPALAAGFRGGDDSWLDPSNGTRTPTDRNGHGTHTLGSALGRGGIGVAPGAQWTGCANLARGLGNPGRYLDCLQFMLAPYPPGGDPWRDGRPARAPHVLTNSWACPPIEGCDEGVLRPATAALQAAGVYAVVSAGNAGPLCETIEDPPAQYPDVLTVGAVDRDGQLSVFSSRGPVPGASKPDLVAPGARVVSALPGGGYGPLDGTSMAAPHVAGVVALMWSANPDLIGDLASTTQILRDTAHPVAIDDPECGGPASLVGAGLVDAHAAVLATR